MNQTIKTILERRSIRKYKAIAVKEEDLNQIIECGKFAATALGLQPWHFSVVTNRDLLNKISQENKKVLSLSPVPAVQGMAKAPNFDCFNGSPAAIIVSGDNTAEYATTDCANAVENMAIAAQALGLGSCYNGIFKVALQTPQGAYLMNEIGIPENFSPLYALSIGYIDKEPGPRSPRREGTVNYVK